MFLLSSFWCQWSLQFWSHHCSFANDDLCKLFNVHLRVDIDLISYPQYLVSLKNSLHFLSLKTNIGSFVSNWLLPWNHEYLMQILFPSLRQLDRGNCHTPILSYPNCITFIFIHITISFSHISSYVYIQSLA